MVANARPQIGEIELEHLQDAILRGLANAEAQHIRHEIRKIAGNAYAIPSGTEADVTYFVVFKDRGVLPGHDVVCNCRAGLNGMMCKHVASALVEHKRCAPDGTIRVRVN